MQKFTITFVMLLPHDVQMAAVWGEAKLQLLWTLLWLIPWWESKLSIDFD